MLGPRLIELSRSADVWIARTLETERLADDLLQCKSPHASDTSGTITLFNGTGDGEADLDWLLDEVELHHGLASNKDSPVTVIRIIGVELTQAVRAMLVSHNFSDSVCDQGDIVARWLAPG